MSASLRETLLVSRAAALARSGSLDAAAEVLGEVGTSASALDLLARVHAQRGDFAAADECWGRAGLAESAPERLTAQAILAGKRRARPLVHSGWLAVGVAVVAIALVAGGGGWLASSLPRARPAPVAATVTVSVPVSVPAPAERPTASAAELAAVVRQAEELARQVVLDDVARRLAMPGVRVERRRSDVRVLFDRGVFWRDAELRSGSGDLLLTLGRRLRSLPVSTTVVGHSVTVPGGASHGGSEVALRRAQVAAGYLADGGGLPLTAFTLVSADQSAGPFPERSRNRTVTLLIRPVD